MSREEFREMLDIPEIKRNTLSNWERDISRPNLEVALQIVKKLNKSVEELWFIP